MSFMVGVVTAFAKGHDGVPPGFQKGTKQGWQQGSVPPGWAHGKKTGWQGAHMPPGLAKKQGETQAGQTRKDSEVGEHEEEENGKSDQEKEKNENK